MLRKNLSTEHTEGTDRWNFLVASLEILEEIFNKEWPWARNHYGFTEDTEGTDGWELDGIILGSLWLEIFGGNLFKDVASQKIF